MCSSAIAALARLAEIGATLVTCPRSNHWVGVGYPPIERFYQSGVKVAVGTDSLASVEDLNLFSELKTMRWLAPNVPASKILESATLIGARALGLGDELGSLAPGKRAQMIAVDLPALVDDIEEFLLSGITPFQIQPLSLLNRFEPLNRLATYLSFIRFSHSVFALAVCADRRAAGVAACAVRMAADPVGDRRDGVGAQRRDGIQPAGRRADGRPQSADGDARDSARRVEQPRRHDLRDRVVDRVRARVVAVESDLRLAVAGRAGDRVLVFAGQAIHVVHAGVSRAGDGRRAGRRLACRRRAVGAAEPWLLGLAIGLWVGGFDILYACQDLEFDRAHGLNSIPVRFGMPRSLSISRVMHVATVICMAALAWLLPLGPIYLGGVALVAALLIYEQSLVSATDLSQVKRAFDLNGWVGILYFVTTGLALYVG